MPSRGRETRCSEAGRKHRDLRALWVLALALMHQEEGPCLGRNFQTQRFTQMKRKLNMVFLFLEFVSRHQGIYVAPVSSLPLPLSLFLSLFLYRSLKLRVKLISETET